MAPFNMNMNQIMKQAKKLQEELQKRQDDLARQTFTASAGGGMVTAVVNGRHELISLKIDPSIVNADDVEMLQDLITAAVNEGLRKTTDAAQGMLGGMAGF